MATAKTTFPRASATALVLILATCAHGQGWQFFFDASGNLAAQMAETSAAPQIIGQPQNQVVVPGESASFSVVAADTRALSYQWRFNDMEIIGAIGEALLLHDVSNDDEGPYTVVLVNPSGSVTSAPAMLMLDTDADGMGDSWEQTYFGSLAEYPTGDADGDGVSNLTEFLDGTDPTNSASAIFRLTLLSDGGNVTVTPNRFRFTNGEMVTLTASAFAPHAFHAWGGDIDETNNPITLTITSNITVFAYLSSYDIQWRLGVNGDWHNRTNWSPKFVPASNDHVFIANGRVTNNSAVVCRRLTIDGPTLLGSGSFTVLERCDWLGGTLALTGGTIIEAGATMAAAGGSLAVVSSTLENRGRVLWLSGNIVLSSANIINRAGALFAARGANSLTPNSGNPRFHNEGTFRKSISGGTTLIGQALIFNNSGAVEIQTGTLDLISDGTHTGTFEAGAGATLSLGGNQTAASGSRFTGAGGLTMRGGVVTLAGLVNMGGANSFIGGTLNLNGTYICTNSPATISGGTATFNGVSTVAALNLNSGTLAGSAVLTVLNQMNWSGGTMSGAGRTVIAPGATLNPNNNVTLNRTLENGGTILWTGGNIAMATAVITNRPGALFHAQNAASLSFHSGLSRFDNAATFRKSLNTGTTTVAAGIALNNYNTVEIGSGILAANGGYTSRSNSLLNCAIGGTAPGIGYGRLQVGGAVTLNGALSLDFINGFVPVINDSFTVLTAGTRNGAFANFFYPGNVTMQLSNTPISVIVYVTGVAPPQPVLLQPELLGSEVRLIWTAVSNATYRLEFNPDLSLTNWTALSGDVTTLSNTASKLDALTPSNRFYRVRVVPP